VRAYLPIGHSGLEAFLAQGSIQLTQIYAATPIFLDENSECDEEEIEYLLAIRAGEAALELRTSLSSPGLVLAIDLEESQCGENYEEMITVLGPVSWSQVACALLAQEGADELAWFATQEIAPELDSWK